MNIRATIVVACALFFMMSQLLAQQTTPTEAQALVQAGKWKEAAVAYEALLKKDAGNLLFWNGLAFARHSMQDCSGAVKAYEKALSLSPNNNSTLLYNLACSYARLGDKPKAFTTLHDAAKAGFNQPATLLSDADFESIRNEGEFKKVVAEVQNNATPCANDPVHRQFDYWVGEWNVINPQGQPAGTSSIQNILGGCVIFENWTGRTGFKGKSFNFVDPGTGKWRQTWVDAVGGKIEFTGELEGTNIVFYADGKDKGGNPFRSRLTFFNMGPDSVRQFSQRTTDEGKTWTVEYDFMYVRKNQVSD